MEFGWRQKYFVGINFLEIVAQRLEFTIAPINNINVYLMLALPM
jgi:hypothetical protein